MFFKSFGLPKAGKTKKYPKRRDYRLRLERLVLLARIDPENRVLAIEKAVAECGERLSKAETRHTEWMTRVRERTGIQTEFTFDSETGVISEISSE